MKPRFANQRNQALARIDVIVVAVIFLLAILAAMLLPVREAARRRDDNLICMNNLRQLAVEMRVWQGDNNPEHPLSAAVTNETLLNINRGQRAWVKGMGLTNLLASAKTLRCPADTTPAETNDLSRLHVKISYFLNLDANENYPQTLLMGDDNFAISGVPVKLGILELSTNTSVTWFGGRHGRIGNIGFADGSVAEESDAGLQTALEYSLNGTPMTTNRLAIP
jgi:prepilin-type processing-associated H-X9-DG protein